MGRSYQRIPAEMYRAYGSNYALDNMSVVPSPIADSAVFNVVYHRLSNITSSNAEIQCTSPNGVIDTSNLKFPLFKRVSRVFSQGDALYVCGLAVDDVESHLYYYNHSRCSTTMEPVKRINLDPFSGAEINREVQLDQGVMSRIEMTERGSEVHFVLVDIENELLQDEYKGVPYGAIVLAMGNGLTVAASPTSTTLMATPFLKQSDNYAHATQRCNLPKPDLDVHPTTAALSPTKDIVAVGYSDGSVNLWDTRYFHRPFYTLRSDESEYTTLSRDNICGTGAVSLLAYNDWGNELYAARKQTSPGVPWIESYDTSAMRSRECLISPQIPLVPFSQRYLDINAVWPPGMTHFELPNEPVDFSHEAIQYVNDERQAYTEVEGMIWKDRKLVVATQAGLLFIDSPHHKPGPSYSLCLEDDEFQTVFDK